MLPPDAFASHSSKQLLLEQLLGVCWSTRTILLEADLSGRRASCSPPG